MGWYGGGVQLHDHRNANNGGALGASTVGTTQLTALGVTVAKLATETTDHLLALALVAEGD